MGDSGAEESDDGWLDDCSSDDEPPVARGRSPDARNGAPSVLAGSSAEDEGVDSWGFIESPDARETPKEATDGWGVEDVELPRAGADDAHREPPRRRRGGGRARRVPRKERGTEITRNKSHGPRDGRAVPRLLREVSVGALRARGGDDSARVASSDRL
jgi:hypothetical protein